MEPHPSNALVKHSTLDIFIFVTLNTLQITCYSSSSVQKYQNELDQTWYC